MNRQSDVFLEKTCEGRWAKIKKWVKRFFAVIFFIVLTAGFAWLAFEIKSGSFSDRIENMKMKARIASRDAGFCLKEVFIEGRVRTSLKDMELALNVRKGMPIMALDLEEIKQRIELLPWVKSAQVERHLPKMLYIRLEEKTPIALYQFQGVHYPLDSDGNLIETSSKGLESLVIVVGDGADSLAPALVQVLEEEYPDLYKRVRSLRRISGRRWDMWLDSLETPLVIKLPEENEKAALQRLEKYENTYHLLDRNLAYIDLRMDDRLIVKPAEQNNRRVLDKDGKESGGEQNKNTLTPEELFGERDA